MEKQLHLYLNILKNIICLSYVSHWEDNESEDVWLSWPGPSPTLTEGSGGWGGEGEEQRHRRGPRSHAPQTVPCLGDTGVSEAGCSNPSIDVIMSSKTLIRFFCAKNNVFYSSPGWRALNPEFWERSDWDCFVRSRLVNVEVKVGAKFRVKYIPLPSLVNPGRSLDGSLIQRDSSPAPPVGPLGW